MFDFGSETLEIIGITLKMALASTFFSSALGIVLGLLLEKSHFPGKRLVLRICRTLMGMPSVVAGLIIYLIFMRKGPLGFMGLLFTIPVMVIAQVVLITPVITGMVCTYAIRSAPAIRAFAKTMGADHFQTNKLFLREMSGEMYFAVITAFSRSISEVGAVMIVGGNIQHKTRTMTTAISMLRNMGDFRQGITLGVMLIILAFILQSLSDLFHKGEVPEENL